MVTIVLAHPWHGSFNKAIVDAIAGKFETGGKPYRIIDLNKDVFNPVMTEQELALYSTGGYLDPLVGTYQEIIGQSDEMIFVFPIWWGTCPAILRGFFDKVLLKGFAFSYENGWTKLLNIRKTTVITTSDAPTSHFTVSIEQDFIPSMLYSVGINNATWINCDKVSKETDAYRKAFLEKVLVTV